MLKPVKFLAVCALGLFVQACGSKEERGFDRAEICSSLNGELKAYFDKHDYILNANSGFLVGTMRGVGDVDRSLKEFYRRYEECHLEGLGRGDEFKRVFFSLSELKLVVDKVHRGELRMETFSEYKESGAFSPLMSL